MGHSNVGSFVIPDFIANRAERFFRADLSGVYLHYGPEPSALCREQKVAAFTIGLSIYFDADRFKLYSDSHMLVLMHELAHIVQKNSSNTAYAGDDLVEYEASAAAIAFQCGLPCPPLSADRPEIPRAWGPEGHYYSVYLAGLLAGADWIDALAWAFYAQAPDQINDFDAVVAGSNWVSGTLVRFALPVSGPLLTKNPENFVDVQQSLHCLTGLPGKIETKYRSDVIESITLRKKEDRFDFGLALHAFGDSFAHRDSDDEDAKMYRSPYGHLAKGKGIIQYALDTTSHLENFFKLGKEVDALDERPKTYKSYMIALVELLSKKTKKNDGAGMKPEDIAKIADKISGAGAEKKQREILCGEIRSRGGKLSYLPEDEDPMPLRAFAKAHPAYYFSSIPERARRRVFLWNLRRIGG
ncbi:DUF4157 domain-containing protein [Methylobacterium dankookense]|uniref:eCIS core domain-containing protein n=1 Tax=Methylobacterium dankookense TaxID=560405 RepID=A0A564FZJ4_9HYPH|nr:DUF4157 domain-containing protein [Methylobacterium dankookense]GJD57067.1 hypothetical protein IFDJLNFL_2967 [Methylobacterium dankookense]VUF13575.1 hypothetical protein MTDSW087_03282 [Methylobacterium dankookense]